MSLGLVVTTYNSIDYVEQFLAWYQKSKSFFSQVVIVDDCSSDKSVNHLRSGVKDDIDTGFLTMVVLEKNSGRPSIPRNCGIERIRTDYVLLLDIDDLLPSGYLEFLIEEAQRCVKCVYSGVKCPISRSVQFNYFYRPDPRKRRRVGGSSIKFKNQVTLSGAFLPSEVARRHSFSNQPLEDWLYWRDLVASESVPIFRLLDVPVGYSTTPTLSPRKARQVSRVSRHLPKFGLFLYVVITLRMKLEEWLLCRRVAASNLGSF